MVKDQNEKKQVLIESRRITGIPVAYESAGELSRLIGFLKTRGYTGYVDRSGPEVVYLHCDSKTYHSTNVTCMACWCSGKNRWPLSVDQFIENYIRIVTDDDVDFYDELTRKRYEEKYRSKQK